MSSVGAIIILCFIVAFYFIPALVAQGRQHPNTTAITILNLFLGWTLLGWVIALVWANLHFEVKGE